MLSPHRPWRQIAHELAIETDTQRILELSEELNCAIEENRIDVGDGDGAAYRDSSDEQKLL